MRMAAQPAVIVNTLMQDNSSGRNGGALLVSNTLTLSTSRLIGNLAGAGGGGVYQASGDSRIANSLFARNTSLGNAGAALNLALTGTGQILFNTIAAPSLVSGDAVRLNGGAVNINDNIINNHAIGLARFSGTVTEDYNLFYGNTANRSGVLIGSTHDVTGTPQFVDPASDQYHILPGSAALDAGGDTGVYTDFDGQTRPLNAGFDIGYDEALIRNLYLPAIMR
jgi:hypothetical protein